jgi:YbbR domain-containing protein
MSAASPFWRNVRNQGARLTLVKGHLSPGTLKDDLRRNMGLRFISVLLALGLWIFVNAGQKGSLVTLQVPIGYGRLPPGYIIVNPHPDFVKIQVSGPRTLLSLIEPNRLALRLDLTGVGVGQASFKIGPDAFPVPRQTSVASVSPSQIVLDIDRIVTRQVRVHLHIIGKPGPGYKIATVGVTPATVAVKGPSREINSIEQVNTDSFDMNGITADTTRTLALLPPEGVARLDTDEVTAEVMLTPVIADKEFHSIPVDVRDTQYKFKVDPTHVNLTVRGTVQVLAKLDLRGLVYVEANGIAPGYHRLPVEVDLPDGVQLVHQSPQLVRVRMYREKRTTNSRAFGMGLNPEGRPLPPVAEGSR